MQHYCVWPHVIISKVIQASLHAYQGVKTACTESPVKSDLKKKNCQQSLLTLNENKVKNRVFLGGYASTTHGHSFTTLTWHH